jgi:serine phosphatase RsbU (regulator of sigma subunit)
MSVTVFSQNRSVDSLIALVKGAKEDTTLVHNYIGLGVLTNKLNDKQKAQFYFKKAYSTSQKMNFPMGALRSLRGLSISYGNQPDSVLYFTDLLLKESLKARNSDYTWMAYAIKSDAYNNKGIYSEASKCGVEALKVAERTGNKKREASAHKIIGVGYAYLFDYKTALAEYNLAREIFMTIRDTVNADDMLFVIGIAYCQIKEYDKALDAYLKCRRSSIEHHDEDGIHLVNNEIISIYRRMKKYDKALELAFESYSYFKQKNKKDDLANTCTKIVGLYFENNKFKEAKPYVDEFMDLAEEMHSIALKRMATLFYSQYYEGIGDYKTACEFHSKDKTLRDSLFQNRFTEQVAEMSKKYESEKKDKELLKKDSEIKVQEAEAKSKSTQRNFFIVGFTLMLTLSFFILRGYQQKKKANLEISKQKHLVDEKQKEILDSIHYAKRIQSALLASKEFVDRYLQDNFIYFNPKDIVSGDFYWATNRNDKFYLAICDSTGHGVPGAFMSLLSIGFLSEAINEKGIYQPGDIFNYARKRLIESVGRDGQKDGFDGILMCFDLSSGNDLSRAKITYAAANNCPVILSSGIQVDQLCDKMPVGIGEKQDTFKTYTLDVKKGDMLFCYTDGYADQFGGPKGKKFKYKKLDELLSANLNKPLSEQGVELEKEFNKWKGSLEQVDDVCVIGIKI